jgi:hydroxyacylglutathione hydrolase
MLLERCYHEGLAQAGYLIACQASGEALVVDPNCQVTRYLDAAARAGVRIVAVAETHIHADVVSGARELARRAGARLLLSGCGPDAWQYGYAAADGARLLRSGDQIAVGRVLLEARHTPGHTPEHLVFLVTDEAAADAPLGMLSGDFLFVGDVGRPDLLERAAGQRGTMAAAARQLYASLRATDALPDYLQIWPGHGAGSACGRALGSVPQTTLGYERRFGWAFQLSEDEFVPAALANQPAPPPYFARMKRINRDGPPGSPASVQRIGLDGLAEALAQGALLVDTRPADAYAAGHVRGALSLPYGPMLVTWGGWLIDGERPLALVADAALAHGARDELALIGADRLVGFVTPGDVAAWLGAGRPAASVARLPAAALRALVEDGATVVDVRRPGEHAARHIPGSHNLPLAELPALLAGMAPVAGPVVVHCEGGGRSPVAAGILAAHGWGPIYEMCDGLRAWAGSLIP